MSNDAKSSIGNQMRRAEWYRLKKDFINALATFDEVEKNLNDDDVIWTWVWAHKGETHLGYAQTLDDGSDEKKQEYRGTVRCFNKAFGERDGSKLKLDNLNSVEDWPPHLRSPWALAHRGEALRTIANDWDDIESNWKREDIYGEAVACFEAAIKLDPDYAWANAHLGATLCNRRLLFPHPLSQIAQDPYEDYKHALRHLNTALEQAEFDYPWCSAYKAVAFVQLQYYELAVYELMVAVMQDKNILTNLIYPPGQFGLPLSKGGLYMQAMWQYLRAVDRQPRDARQQVYILYYQAGVVTMGLDKTAQKEIKLKVSANEEEEKPRNFEDMASFIQKGAVERADKALGDLEKQCPSDDPDVLYMKGGLIALKAGPPPEGNGDRTEWDENLHGALGLLQEAIGAAAGDKEKYKKQARLDVAWYHLRTDQRFKDITEE